MKFDKQAILDRAQARADALESLYALLDFRLTAATEHLLWVQKYLNDLNAVRNQLDREGLDQLPLPLQTALHHVPTLMKAVAGLLDSETSAGQQYGLKHLVDITRDTTH